MHIASICAKEVKDLRTTQSHILPIYPTSSFVFENIDEEMAVFANEKPGHMYARYGNPTMDSVAAKIATLEGAGLGLETAALLVSTGMATVSTLVLSLLKPGDKILTQGNLYGGTTELLLKVFQPLGIEPLLMDLHDLDRAEEALKKDEKIKLLYFETPANPTLACVDIEALAGLAKKYGRLSAIDNTFATPYLQQPFKYGVDYVLHSTTKFLNGHGNSMSGAIVSTRTEQMRMGGAVWNTLKLTGSNCNAFDAWLLHNGMKTLAVRMDKHCLNAMAVAKFLQNDKRVKTVNYCGLPEHPDYAIAKKQMSGFGGMLSFEIEGGLEAGIRFMNRIQFCCLAPTLGDVDSLILHPASSSHLKVPKEVREKFGITDGLVRLSVGIEQVEDIIADLEQALG